MGTFRIPTKSGVLTLIPWKTAGSPRIGGLVDAFLQVRGTTPALTNASAMRLRWCLRFCRKGTLVLEKNRFKTECKDAKRSGAHRIFRNHTLFKTRTTTTITTTITTTTGCCSKRPSLSVWYFWRSLILNWLIRGFWLYWTCSLWSHLHPGHGGIWQILSKDTPIGFIWSIPPYLTVSPQISPIDFPPGVPDPHRDLSF